MRPLHAAGHDLRLQWRYGIMAATVFVVVLWCLLLVQLPAGLRSTVLPYVILLDTGIIGLFFIPALILFERDEGTRAALMVSPLRFGEYACAKVVTLSGLALAATLVLVAVAGVSVALPWLLAGVVLLSVVSTLAGMIVVTPFTSITDYLTISPFVLTPLALPIVLQVAGVRGMWRLLLPGHGPLALLLDATSQADGATLGLTGSVAALASSLAWIALLAWCARVAARRVLRAPR